jgi:hypothetical protein
MLELPPHRPKYIMSCDMANGSDYSVTITKINDDGRLEYIINRNE